MKTFKNLFIKDDAEEENQPSAAQPGFPVGEPHSKDQAGGHSNPYLAEILEVYDKGLESINMPGYDFFDFYVAVKAAGAQSEAIYKMAFQMGKTMDSGITADKLASDADYYISKINEVYQTYSEQGKQRLKSLDTQLKSDKDSLAGEVTKMESEISRLRQQIQALEGKLTETRNELSKVDGKYKPQQDSIQQKLYANDEAMKISVQKLNAIKEGILKFLK